MKRNASIGADIALSIFRQAHNTNVIEVSDTAQDFKANGVVVMGGSVVDLIAKPDANTSLLIGSSTPGTCHESFGGMLIYDLQFYKFIFKPVA